MSLVKNLNPSGLGTPNTKLGVTGCYVVNTSGSKIQQVKSDFCFKDLNQIIALLLSSKG